VTAQGNQYSAATSWVVVHYYTYGEVLSQ